MEKTLNISKLLERHGCLGKLGNGAGSFCERDNGAWRALEVLAGRFLYRDRSLRDFKDLGHANGGWVTVMGLGPCQGSYGFEILQILNNRQPRAHEIGLAHSLNAEAGIGGGGPQGDEEDLIVVEVDDIREGRAELLEPEGVEWALKNGILKPGPVGFTNFGNPAQAAGVADIVTDKEAGAHGQGEREGFQFSAVSGHGSVASG